MNASAALALRIQAQQVWLDARLVTPSSATALIVLAIPHAARLADARDAVFLPRFHHAGLATLQVCMLSPYEHERDPDLRYDIALLDQRLRAISDWITQQPGLGMLPRGILATDTIAAAAIRVLARDPACASALVCRAGRPELAGTAPLRNLVTPTLLQIAGAEHERLAPSEQAYARMECVRDWQVFETASASFIEPGTADPASLQAQHWFVTHIAAPPDLQAQP